MKLNNHGFGMRDMIIYTCVLLLFLLFVAYSVNSLYGLLQGDKKDPMEDQLLIFGDSKENNNVDEDNSEPENNYVDYEYYEELENKLKNATLSYLNDYKYDLSSEILKVTSDTLINLSYLDDFYDQFNSNVCVGYSNVYTDVNTNSYNIKAYISCSNYISEGY